MPESSSQQTRQLQVGSQAPDFAAVTSDGKTIRLSDYRGRKIVVLYFYPQDDTPGCTKQAEGFRDAHLMLEATGAEVIGISPDTPESHEHFRQKYNLPFGLVADPDRAICASYGVSCDISQSEHGAGVKRTTFIINRQGNIARIFEDVTPKGHEQEVLEWIRQHPDA